MGLFLPSVALRRQLSLWLVVMGMALSWMSGVHGQESASAAPQDPKRQLHTDILVARVYGRVMERALRGIDKQYPKLSAEAAGARGAWKSSPFGQACDDIEASILRQMGEQGRANLKTLDEESWEKMRAYMTFDSAADARVFIKAVHERAKGVIESDVVRGVLLSQNEVFKKKPEEEMALGYKVRITQELGNEGKLVYDVPMSWKKQPTQMDEVTMYQSWYGHATPWMNVTISPAMQRYGVTMTAQQQYDMTTEEGLSEEYQARGLTLTSFTKTKVNGMLAIMLTRVDTYEQLGVKRERASKVVRVFTKDHRVNFQINTMAPEGQVEHAVEELQQLSLLFDAMAGSAFVLPKER